jgi:hypothetical protein
VFVRGAAIAGIGFLIGVLFQLFWPGGKAVGVFVFFVGVAVMFAGWSFGVRDVANRMLHRGPRASDEASAKMPDTSGHEREPPSGTP